MAPPGASGAFRAGPDARPYSRAMSDDPNIYSTLNAVRPAEPLSRAIGERYLTGVRCRRSCIALA